MTQVKQQLSVDDARLYFLLVMSNRPGPLSRGYLAEKVMMLWRCKTAWEVRNRLDLESQRSFDEMIANEDYAPVRMPE